MSRIAQINAPHALLIGLTAVTIVFLFVLMSTTTSAFGVYNPAWDGTSSLRQQASAGGSNSMVVTETSGYTRTEPRSTVAIILSPDTAYAPREAARVRAFVRSGGTLVVAEDFGPHTNPFLEDVGARARVDGRPLRDEQRYDRTPAFAVATGVKSHPLTGSTSQLTLNHGTAVQPNGASVLVRSSPFAYLDTNRNESPDDDEQIARYPVVTVENLGQGQVIVVSDPSIFINAMDDRPDNRQFTRALLSNHETALLDYSHTGTVPPLVAARFAVQQSQVLRALLGFAGITAVALLKSRFD